MTRKRVHATVKETTEVVSGDKFVIVLASSAVEAVLMLMCRLPAVVTPTRSMPRPGGTLNDCGTKGRSEGTVPGAAQYIVPVMSFACHMRTDLHAFFSW